MSETKPAMVHYRKWTQGTNTQSLSGAIAQALNVRRGGVRLADDWKLRIAPVSGGSEQRRLVNNVHVDEKSVFGCLCAYTAAEMQTFIATHRAQGQASNVPLEDIPAPSDGDFLHGIAYWLIIGNHCYIVQDARVRTKALEEYLTWLLLGENALVAKPVILQAKFDTGDIGGDLGDIKNIEVGGLVPGTPAREAEKLRSLGKRTAPFSKGIRLLEELLGRIEANQLLEMVPSDADLKVVLQVFYKTRTRQVDRIAMDELATALRNMDDGDVRVRAKDGSLHSDEARLHTSMTFRRVHDNGNLLELSDTRDKLMEVHRRFRYDDKISDE